MNILDKTIAYFKPKQTEMVTLANSGKPVSKSATSYVPQIVDKTISKTRQDIKNWNDAQNLALLYILPKRWMLYNLFDNVKVDLHFQSQMNNRILKSLSRPFVIKNADGKTNIDLTTLLQNKKWLYNINKSILETVFFGHSLVEFDYKDNELVCNLIPRQNVEPKNGCLFLDYFDDKAIKYREMKEYGSWIIEFGEKDNFGLINGCVPHILFKRFAQSCWSELCEIYGIPPRVMKTNTQDKLMVKRAEKMMTDMGSAAWFIIDDSESFEFAKGVNTNGDVYSNLITLCNNEISMGVSGANVGQDTKNGSNGKEKTSLSIVADLVDSDMSLLEQYWNSTVIPALQLLGILPQGVMYGYDATEDLDKLWTMTIEAANFLEVDPTWVKTKFGIEVTGIKQQTTPAKLNFEDGFFV